MQQVTTKLTTVLAGLALASLPVLVGAQNSSTPQPPQPTNPTSTTTSQQNRSTKDQNSPQHHLDEAKRALNSISASSLQGDARTQVTELRRHFEQLESAWRTTAAGAAKSGATATGHATGHTSGTATGSTGGTTSGTTAGTTAGTTGTPEQAGATGATSRPTPRSGSTASGSDDWMTHYAAIDRILDQMRAATGTPPAASTSLDATTRTKLTEFRRHIDLFHQTAMPKKPMGEEDAASASSSSGITGSMTGATTGTSGMATHPEHATAQPSASQPPMSQVQTTSGSTSASGTVDNATIARLTAQIDDLLRGGAATSAMAGTMSSPPGTPATTGSAGTMSSPGSVGTSGTTTGSGTICVDRAKLEQLKRDIQALQGGARR